MLRIGHVCRWVWWNYAATEEKPKHLWWLIVGHWTPPKNRLTVQLAAFWSFWYPSQKRVRKAICLQLEYHCYNWRLSCSKQIEAEFGVTQIRAGVCFWTPNNFAAIKPRFRQSGGRRVCQRHLQGFRGASDARLQPWSSWRSRIVCMEFLVGEGHCSVLLGVTMRYEMIFRIGVFFFLDE